MRCPHCHRDIIKRKALVVEHHGEAVSLRELSRMTGIAYSTLQGRYDRGHRGEQLLGAVDFRRSRNRPKLSRGRNVSSLMMNKFLLGGST